MRIFNAVLVSGKFVALKHKSEKEQIIETLLLKKELYEFASLFIEE